MCSKYAPNTKAMITHKNVSIGDYTYGVPRLMGLDGKNKLSIGRFCSIAGEVHIMMGGRHHDEFVSTYPFYHGFSTVKRWAQGSIEQDSWKDKESANVTIGHDVWLGWGCLIMPGVSIGNGAVIGARTVVSKNVPPYAVVVGSPMRVTRYRFTQEQIRALEEIQWWNWSEEKIQQELPYLMSKNVDVFIKRNRHS